MSRIMEIMGLLHFARILFVCLPFMLHTCIASPRSIGRIYPGFQASQMDYVDQNGVFLLSNNSAFSFGFYTALDPKFFVLVIIHLGSTKAIWTANRAKLVRNFDNFVFRDDGNVYLEGPDNIVWSTNTTGESVAAMELLDNGNLVLVSDNGTILWQSYSHPSDTLMPGQEFAEGMRLKSFPNSHSLNHYLEIKNGSLILYAGFRPAQQYWSMSSDDRKTVSEYNRKVHSASLVSNSWNFYDQDKVLVWQFNFSAEYDPNATWTAVLGPDGAISFYNLEMGKSVVAESTKIPQDSCSLPESCDPYYVCSFDNRCQCPDDLGSQPNCTPQTPSSCNSSDNSFDLSYVGEKLNYFALQFVPPNTNSDLNGCKQTCLNNCSCHVLFFENSTGNCFIFDEIGSLQRADLNSTGFVSFAKVSTSTNRNNGGGKKNPVIVIVIISVATSVIISGLLYMGLWYHQKTKRTQEDYHDTLEVEEDDFWENLSGKPVRFSYADLQIATRNFSVKLGQGGFGSVYEGVLPDDTRVAVKKLEGIGQGKKEFRAEVSIIGSIHHVHLVKLKGFCAQGTHRLLVYEYLGKGSLDKWIFNNNEDKMLDWDTRFNIALGMAKGLAYLHEGCDSKIVHCDIKPENVLLDDNFLAKVSDFGLAKLMSREQSHVFTTLRGTRGYLAPEWITNHAISEKSDVYSFGMVLLEIISGRKSYDPNESSKKTSFPSYAFNMMEEGKWKDILDPRLNIDENNTTIITAIKAALWCIQDDIHLRPPMTKVVQILEGQFDAPQPPTSSPLISRLYAECFKWSSDDGSPWQSIDCNSKALLSSVRLSGPR